MVLLLSSLFFRISGAALAVDELIPLINDLGSVPIEILNIDLVQVASRRAGRSHLVRNLRVDIDRSRLAKSRPTLLLRHAQHMIDQPVGSVTSRRAVLHLGDAERSKIGAFLGYDE